MGSEHWRLFVLIYSFFYIFVSGYVRYINQTHTQLFRPR